VNSEDLGEVNELLELENFSKYISFKSISGLDSYKADLLDCAKWLAEYLRGFCEEVNTYETIYKPVIVAKCFGIGANKPPVGIYGHYDVQPISRDETWDSDSFVLTLRNGRFYARGAQNNKRQF
jgi:acetylornithine deacetylase/succinyl-diaminopimelate desuccinylase-like protein